MHKEQEERLKKIADRGKQRIDVICSFRGDKEPRTNTPPDLPKVNYHAMIKGRLS